MSMGTAAGHGWVASEKWLKTLNLKSWDKLQRFIKEHGDYDVWQHIDEDLTLEIEETIEHGDPDDDDYDFDIIFHTLTDVWRDVCDDFYEKTNLTLSIYYHDKETYGDSYDEIDGLVYFVDVVDIKPQAKPYIKSKKIREVFWTIFG
jgi:hypothetical protein